MAAQVGPSLDRWFTPVALAESPGVGELGFVAAGLCGYDASKVTGIVVCGITIR